MKKIIALLTIFFLFIYTAHSLKVFEIEETETISLKPNVEDPDNDLLTYTYEEPLNLNGEWETTYGDAGDYNTSVTVSDGTEAVTEDILIIVYKKEEKPVIDDFSPEEGVIKISENEEVRFRVNASDINGDELEYTWAVDGASVSRKSDFLYKTGYNDQGTHEIRLTVSDGRESVAQAWVVSVEDVDVDSIIFDTIRDKTVKELDIASLDLPDFESYGLEYEISDPLGDDNLWQTGYNDSGDYEITVFATGEGYFRKKTVVLTVEDTDRPPKLSETKTYYISEDEELELMLEAFDEDGDEITFSAEMLPEDAFFEDDTFIWMPSFDVVQKETILDAILAKFKLLSRTKKVEFVAMSNELEDRQTVTIVVKDMNRPFELEPIEPIVVNEGEEIVIEPIYSDPDGDRVTFDYSGFMISPRKKTSFEDAGHYVVRIEASDGHYRQTLFVDVIIENVNRAPEFSEIPTLRVVEGQEVSIQLDAKDPDNNDITFYSDNLPNGAFILKDKLVWVPETAVSSDEREFSFTIIATDGNAESTQEATFIVEHVNTAPRIIRTSNTQVTEVGKTTTFEIEALDEDGDELTYEWDFGFFDTFDGDSTHNRRFSSRGTKEVTVTVSDGQEEVSKTWKVRVV